MNNKVALITGGAQGIGKAIAQLFLKKGMSVAIFDEDAEAGKETENEFKTLGQCIFIEGDASQESAAQKAVQSILSHFKSIDYLINNAGIMIRKPIEELSLKEWHDVLNVNLTSIFLFTKYAVPSIRAKQGAIVNISSTRALMSEPNTESYSASKGGVVALTHALALSLGPEIRVNCISPGWIETSEWKKSQKRHLPHHTKEDLSQHPVGRVGEPQDIASLVAYLVSSEASFITGQNFIVDGGMTRKMIYKSTS